MGLNIVNGEGHHIYESSVDQRSIVEWSYYSVLNLDLSVHVLSENIRSPQSESVVTDKQRPGNLKREKRRYELRGVGGIHKRRCRLVYVLGLIVSGRDPRGYRDLVL